MKRSARLFIPFALTGTLVAGNGSAFAGGSGSGSLGGPGAGARAATGAGSESAKVLPQAAVPADFARLVPDDAFLVVRLSSLDSLVKETEWMRQTLQIDGEQITTKLLAEEMFGEFGFAPEMVDTSAPIGLALSLQGAAPPIVIAIVPCTDPAAVVAKFSSSGGGAVSLVSGKFVGVRESGTLALSQGTSRLVTGDKGGLASVRIDLAKVIQTFGPFIDMGLDQAEQMLDSGALVDEDMPFDMTEYFQWYMDMVRDLKDSVDLLDIHVDVRGNDLDFRGSLNMLAGSAMTQSASTVKVDYPKLAALLDPTDSIQVLSNYDASSFMDAVWGMYSGMASALRDDPGVPEGVADAFEVYLEKGQQMMTLIGPITCASGSFGADGLRMSGMYTSKDAGALLQCSVDMIGDPAFAKLGVITSVVSDSTEAGTRTVQTRTKLDLDRLMQVFAPAENIEADELAKLKLVVQKFIGPNGVEMLASGAGDRMFFSVGPDAAYRTSSMTRLRGGGSAAPAPAVSWLCQQIEGCNPATIAYFDFGALMGGLYDMAALMEESVKTEAAFLKELGQSKLPMSFHWGVAQTEWRGGLRLERATFSEIGKVIAKEKAKRKAASEQIPEPNAPDAPDAPGGTSSGKDDSD